MSGNEAMLLLLMVAGSVSGYRLGRADGELAQKQKDIERRFDAAIARIKEEQP